MSSDRIGVSPEDERHSAEFDRYADSYSEALKEGLSASGETQEFFAEQRIRWFAKRAAKLGFSAKSILDFGCGQGSSTPLLLDSLGGSTATGVDVSAELIEIASRRHHDPRIHYERLSGARPPKPAFDCAYTNGVFHHIPVDERAAACRYVFESLRPGGLFALWENNPWNPGTRYVMRRIPFDADAVTLSIPECAKLASSAGFEIVRIDSRFFFPRALRMLRRLEPWLSWTRLGGQYMILCRKTGRTAASGLTAIDDRRLSEDRG